MFNLFLITRNDLVRNFGELSRYIRDPKQIWTSMSIESSINWRSSSFFRKIPELNRLFNWTLFTSKNATISHKYFHIYKTEKSKNDQRVTNSYAKLTMEGKTKDFCWIVSNCKLFWNNRFQIADQLIGNLSSTVHTWGGAVKQGCVKQQENLIGILSKL